jgi:hypothetical protein
MTVEIQYDPFHVIVRDPSGREITKTLHSSDSRCLQNYSPMPCSYVRSCVDMHRYNAFTLQIHPGEHFYGCGESFTEAIPAIPDPAAQVGTTLYATLEEALKKAPDGSTVQLFRDGENVTVSNGICLDLNGFDLRGVTVTGALILKDSQTDDFSVEDAFGYGTVTQLSGNVTAAEGYLLITEDGAVSAHRLELRITDMVLRPSAVGVYYQSAFFGDAVVARNVASCGVALSLKGQPTPADPRSWYDGFQTGTATGTLLKGILKTTYTQAENAANGEAEIYGSAYIRTQEGQYIFGDCVQRSLRQQMELIDAQWESLDVEQRSALVEMYLTYADIMSAWNIPNLLKAL